MENKRLKLPAGIHTFEKLREKNCVYVDMTVEQFRKFPVTNGRYSLR